MPRVDRHGLAGLHHFQPNPPTPGRCTFQPKGRTGHCHNSRLCAGVTRCGCSVGIALFITMLRVRYTLFTGIVGIIRVGGNLGDCQVYIFLECCQGVGWGAIVPNLCARGSQGSREICLHT
jgi:hypothetical protein